MKIQGDIIPGATSVIPSNFLLQDCRKTSYPASLGFNRYNSGGKSGRKNSNVRWRAALGFALSRLNEDEMMAVRSWSWPITMFYVSFYTLGWNFHPSRCISNIMLCRSANHPVIHIVLAVKDGGGRVLSALFDLARSRHLAAFFALVRAYLSALPAFFSALDSIFASRLFPL